MGFAEGFSAMDTALTRKSQNTRAEKQQQLTALAQGYEFDQDAGTYKPTANTQTKMAIEEEQLKVTMDAMQSELQALKSQQSADGITETIANIISGNWEDAKHNYNKIRSTLAKAPKLDVANISPINFNDPTDLKQLKELGIDTSKINTDEIKDAFNRSMLKVIGHDGNTRIMPVDQIVKTTNTWNMMNSKQRDGYTQAARNINAILKGSGLTFKEQQLQEAKTDVAVGQTALQQQYTEEQLKQIEEYRKRPDATIQGLNAILNPPKAGDIKEEIELSETKKDIAVKENAQAIVQNLLNTKSEFTQQQVDYATRLQGDKKLDTKDKDLVTANYNTVKALAPIYNKIAQTDVEWNALNKGLKDAIALGGGTVEDLARLSPKEKEAIYKRMNIDAQLQSAIADYIKMMSGAAVTDDERKFYNNAIMSGAWSTKDAALNSMDGFMEQQMRAYDNNLDRIAYNYPLDYINQKRLRNNAMEAYESIKRPIKQTEPTKSMPSRQQMIDALKAAQGAR